MSRPKRDNKSLLKKSKVKTINLNEIFIHTKFRKRDGAQNVLMQRFSRPSICQS